MSLLPPSSKLRFLVAVGSLMLLLAVWEIVGRHANPLMITHPSAILAEAVRQLSSGQLQKALLESLWPLFLGFTVAIAAGVPIGILLGRYWVPRAAFGFLVVCMYTTPLIAYLPMFILWFGLGLLVKVILVTSFSISPIIISTWRGVRTAPRTLVDVGRAFCASQSYITWRIIFPHALPAIMTGIRLGVGRAVVAIAVAELFTSISGLGGLLLRRAEDYDTAGTFVPALVLMALGLIMTGFFGWLERRIAPWHRAAFDPSTE